MNPGRASVAALTAIICLMSMGCASTDGSSGGWVVIGQPQPAPQPDPPPRKQDPAYGKKNKGMERASRNHLRSAYRFLVKGKPDHALKELEKARRKAEGNFWFHYYTGGAYFYKGMYQKARESWQFAFWSTREHTLRSRSRTCQSFAVYQIEGMEASKDYLLRAADLDGKNSAARELLKGFSAPGEKRIENRPEVQVGFMKPGDDDPEKGKGHGRNKGHVRDSDDDDRDRDGKRRKGKKPNQKGKMKKN